MQNDQPSSAKDVTDPSKASAPSKHTTQPFMLKNPFKSLDIDWLSILIILMLSSAGLLFVMTMRLIASES